MSTTSSVRIKVSRATLTAKVQEARQAKLDAYSERLTEYPNELAEWESRAAMFFAALANRANTGRVPDIEGWGLGKIRIVIPRGLKNPGSRPNKPTRPDTSTEDRDLRLLKVSEDESFSVTVHTHWARYF